MKNIRPVLLAVAFCLLAVRAHAHNALFTITPQCNQAGGIFFRITSQPLASGDVQFRVLITENQAKFNRYPLAELGILKDTKSARSIHGNRKLTTSPSTTSGAHSLVCVFNVDRKSLEDPNFCFFFSNLDHAIDDKILFALSKDFVFARLKDFAPHRR